MQSFLEPNGLYNPSLRFAFTNITADTFTSYWGGVPIVVEPSQCIEISNTTPIVGAGHALAIKMTGELVNNIMIGNIKLDEVTKNQPYYRSPQGSSLGVPAARKVWEDQILRELAPDEESPAMQTIRQQMQKEIVEGASEKTSVEPPPSSPTEFADINTSIKDAKTPATPKKPAKVKAPKE